MAVLLPIPDDPRFQWLIDNWPESPYGRPYRNRAEWLRDFETMLGPYYPTHSSRDRSLTARHAAPFPLAAGHDVP